MKIVSGASWVRRHLPQTVRLRLSLLYAALFLLAGVALLAITYGLVANSLPSGTSSKLTANQEAKAEYACKIARESFSSPLGKLQPHAVPGSCAVVFRAGVTAATSQQRAQTLHDLLLFSLIGLVAMTVVSGVLGWLMARRVLRPVRTITDAARRASEEHLGERLALQGPDDELKELADTFDGMLDRLDASFASQRRFVADASHELRTPLTVMRTSIDVTLAKPSRSIEQFEAMATKVRRSVDQAESLIEALLTMASSERGPREDEEVDLATLAEDALDSVSSAMKGMDLRVNADLQPAPASGDRVLLERMVGNLVDNATRHNQKGGWVDVVTGTRDNEPFLTIGNGGQVIPTEVVDSLFEPFRRVEVRTNRREGVGLGLAIVKSICDAHGARIEAQGQLGGGLAISVFFRSVAPSLD